MTVALGPATTATGLLQDAGILESTSGGIKFPDATIQTTWVPTVIRAVATSDNVVATDDIVLVTGNSAAVTLTLPLANTVPTGRKFIIKDGGLAGTYNVTIARSGADVIDGGTSAVLVRAYTALVVVSDGVSKYWIM